MSQEQRARREHTRLGTVVGIVHAKLLQEMLEEEGISSYAEHGRPSLESVISGQVPPPPPAGETETTLVTVYVREGDFPKAWEVWQAFESRDMRIAREEEEPDEEA
jgi:pentatricopeptide repeat protein